MCPLQAPFLIVNKLLFFFFLLLRLLTVLMKQTRQAVCAVEQSIFLRCLWLEHSEWNLNVLSDGLTFVRKDFVRMDFVRKIGIET